MPTTNKESREWAHQLGASTYCEFRQSNGSCVAYVAMWLRKRSRGKTFFGEPTFKKEDLPEGRVLFQDENDDIEPPVPLKASTKAAALQQKLKPSDAAEVSYITTGSKGVNAALVAVAHAGKGFVSNKAWDGSGMVSFVRELAVHKHLASVGLSHGAISHAIGFDCSQAIVAYFDPNLGEVTFPSVDALTTWWQRCYSHDRKLLASSTVPGAWKQFNDTPYTAKVFKR